MDEASLQSWYAEPNGKKVGQPFLYSDAAIELALTLRVIYHLTLRATQGFVTSIFELMGITLDVPDYTTLCRRAAKLNISLDRIPKGEPIHLAIDSTGLKVFGEGEWKVRTHGAGKRRTWRKLHIGLDVNSREIVAVETTESNVHDSHVIGQMIPHSGEKIGAIYADGAYDNHHSYDAAAQCQAAACIDPRSGAALATGKNITPGQILRNNNINEIWKIGKEEWKRQSGYHKRSMVENTMFRIKTIFGPRMSSRDILRQKTEGCLKAAALNKMTRIGMPMSEKVQS
jgi:IS5 family transposase